MTILDKPSLEVCSVKRARTNSPSTALVLLNDRHFVDCARKLATDMMNEDSDEQAIKVAWLRVTSSTPSQREIAILKEIYEDAYQNFDAQPDNANRLLQVGITPHPKNLDPIKTAAFTVLCQAIYNSDSAIWKR
jgi:myo-inositol catabolism protein IolC